MKKNGFRRGRLIVVKDTRTGYDGRRGKIIGHVPNELGQKEEWFKVEFPEPEPMITLRQTDIRIFHYSHLEIDPR